MSLHAHLNIKQAIYKLSGPQLRTKLDMCLQIQFSLKIYDAFLKKDHMLKHVVMYYFIILGLGKKFEWKKVWVNKIVCSHWFFSKYKIS